MDRRREACLPRRSPPTCAAIAIRRSGSTPRALAISGSMDSGGLCWPFSRLVMLVLSQAEPRGQLGLGHPALLPELADGAAEGLQEVSRHADKPDLP